MTMQRVELGHSGIEVSALALGCMSLTREREADSHATVARAYELGIDLFDTADIYGRGESEQLLGAALKAAGIARDKVVIASKCGIVFPGMDDRYQYKAYDLSPAYLKASVEASLRRLGTDYIDLYQPHRIDYLTHPQEIARALEDLRQAGKIRHVGVSNYTADEIRALGAAVPLVSLQTQFSVLHLEPIETGLTAVCAEKQMAVLCWSPLQGGALAGGAGDADRGHDDWQQQRAEGAAAQLRAFADRYGWTMAQLALTWLLQLPGPVIPLVGTASPAHLAEAVAAVGNQLDRDDWYELMVIGRGRPMPWRQPPYVYLNER